ncbi:hypothetical protein Taro_055983 [Colocasia esculenta]|uniref:Fungal lipase-type domain-containing protein n=1 Tax=Colocasia esculenta TaxID=4460 RepID=A0A843XSQ8_COLES|nr:hypothetical protein [Colocasia esculenta]
MGSASPDHYMVFRQDKLRFRDVFRLLFTKKRLVDYNFVDCSSHAEFELGDVHADWTFALLAAVQRILFAISTPLKWVGVIVEFFLNFWSLNGGLLGLIRRILTVSVTIPVPGSASYRSIIGHVDGRFDLYKEEDASHLVSSVPMMDSLGDIKPLDLTMMAAKIVYENPHYIKHVVNNCWKMHFVAFFDCWNKFLTHKTTQAFVFCDRREDARLICVAFRGTEPFNADDWLTDTDLSYISMGPDKGRVHLGFMKALGIQDETNFGRGFPKDLPQDHPHHHVAAKTSSRRPLAYYAIRHTLEELLAEHPNAKILVTGHSLGAALACLFPALLVYHRQDAILDRVLGVVTHAQPRVGDKAFKLYMESAAAKLKFYRMVYRHDMVPRVPFDRPPFSMFTHFGTCVYYHNWYTGQVVNEMPMPNYFDLDPVNVIPMYLHAWGDLVRAFFLGRFLGKDFEEGWISIIYRLTGLLIPGVASHSPRDYLNGARLARIPTKFIH